MGLTATTDGFEIAHHLRPLGALGDYYKASRDGAAHGKQEMPVGGTASFPAPADRGEDAAMSICGAPDEEPNVTIKVSVTL